MKDKKGAKSSSEEELSKVVADELLREKIRQEIKSQLLKSSLRSQRTDNLIIFLNSNLGIWLLSSVLISLISFGYGHLNSHLKEKSETSAKIKKIDTEIAYRLKLRSLDAPISMEGSFINLICDSPSSMASRWTNMRSFNSPENPFYRWEKERFVYPEFKERSIISLIWELESVEKEFKTKEDLRLCRENLEKLRDRVEVGDSSVTTKNLESIILKRWLIN